MKTPHTITPQPNIKTKQTRLNIRDTLDSLSNEEQDFKGNDVTHNSKQHHHIKSAKKS